MREEVPVVRVGVVGSGFIADAHAAAIAADPRAELVAVCDRVPAAAAAFVRKWGGTAYADADEMAASPDVDAVIVCTPNNTHADLARTVHGRGKHLLMEKPIALNLAESREITQLFRESGLVFLAGHTHRHSDFGRAVQECIGRGDVGTVEAIRLAITGGWIWPGWQAWVLDPERSGGHAFHNGVHLYDLVAWWLGSPIVRVSALGQRLTSGEIAIDDSLVATLVAESGAIAVCEISRGERPRATNLFETVVHGTAGTLVRRWSSDGNVAFTDEGSGPVPALLSDPFRRQLGVWVSAIIDGVPVSPTIDEALHSIEVAEAVTRAARSGHVEEVTR